MPIFAATNRAVTCQVTALLFVAPSSHGWWLLNGVEAGNMRFGVD